MSCGVIMAICRGVRAVWSNIRLYCSFQMFKSCRCWVVVVLSDLLSLPSTIVWDCQHPGTVQVYVVQTASQLHTIFEKEQLADRCRDVSSVVWHNVQIGLACPPRLIIRSAVRILFCNNSHRKNLHFPCTFAFHNEDQYCSVRAPMNWTFYADFAV